MYVTGRKYFLFRGRRKTMGDELQERVRLFNMMQLPGQPPMMHMGTAYLVNDLWFEVQDLRNRLAALDAGKEDTP
jgi:hypothetical protein